ncbi:NADP-dependent phosphogluconate dehydrogenase [Goodfellowiella coeruleoviolacea]|uniref:6-phosphogluconate dehydrogenase n=1 Tax=Goodfellowiella coeruleoviolacea TaxID=334858 RepID=A0AAE3G9G6_9PSEU|nr:NADP-dependent phosphogluconate dehydrogenase [Goodfellowiella coeruleoviolacea]MCP2163182.1 6-phosphogluconate dehydrogenase [Goodfellowiella coeruleoviolacea]
MQLGLVGLGTMGGPMARRIADAGHDVIGADSSPTAVERARTAGTTATGSLAELVAALAPPRVVWVMVPPPVTATVLDELARLLDEGDLVVDGGNSDWRQAAGRAARLAESGVRFLDVGVSGGQWGWRHGYGLTVGGAAEDAERVWPVLVALAAPDAVALVGPTGSGHFVKAVHNAVEYGLMQAYAEGFALLSSSEGIDPLTALRVWQAGCSVRSFLLEQTVDALAANPGLTGVGTAVADSGMGRWTATEAVRRGIATPVLTAALQARFASRDDDRAANRLLVAARAQIGGHSRG